MTTVEKTPEEVRRLAKKLFSQDPDWATFYREILGRHGVVRHAFPTVDALKRFEASKAYRDIQQMLATLRRRGSKGSAPEEPIKVITVRLPESLHEALRIEAHEHHTSMNSLCISKLLQVIDRKMTPSDA